MQGLYIHLTLYREYDYLPLKGLYIHPHFTGIWLLTHAGIKVKPYQKGPQDYFVWDIQHIPWNMYTALLCHCEYIIIS